VLGFCGVVGYGFFRGLLLVICFAAFYGFLYDFYDYVFVRVFVVLLLCFSFILIYFWVFVVCSCFCILILKQPILISFFVFCYYFNDKSSFDFFFIK
jgi:hypothetical protein